MTTAVAEARAADRGRHPDRPASIVHGRGRSASSARRVAPRRGRNRPAVVGADLGDTIRASCRATASVDLGATLEQCADLFTRYGGHRRCRGLRAPRGPLARRYVERVRSLIATQVPPDPRATLAIDVAVPALDVDYALQRDLVALAPYGPATPCRSSPCWG
jgi:single-stranded-DNA-specific exonuclease